MTKLITLIKAHKLASIILLLLVVTASISIPQIIHSQEVKPQAKKQEDESRNIKNFLSSGPLLQTNYDPESYGYKEGSRNFFIFSKNGKFSYLTNPNNSDEKNRYINDKKQLEVKNGNFIDENSPVLDNYDVDNNFVTLHDQKNSNADYWTKYKVTSLTNKKIVLERVSYNSDFSESGDEKLILEKAQLD